MIPIWLIVDANNHVHRDFHATARADQATSLFGKRLEAMRKSLALERIVVAFDAGTSFRSRLDPAYKANRSEKGHELRLSLQSVRELCLAEEIDVVQVEEFEADDILATLAKMAHEHGRRVILSSTDKDLRQLLVPDSVTQLVSVAREGERLRCDWMTADKLLQKKGVRPEQWPDYQMLVGDAVDNIKGAENIGPKTALKILQACGSLNNYWAEVWCVNLTSKQRTSMAAFRRRAGVVRRLVTLRQDVPLPAAWMELVE